jgi:hypothetical protein
VSDEAAVSDEAPFSFLDQAVHQLNKGLNESAQAAALVVIASELGALRREFAWVRAELSALNDQLGILTMQRGR